MKVKLFTHTDLDGIGCAIVAKYIYDEVDVDYCNYNKVDERVSNFIEEKTYNEYDKVFITDISVNETVAELIDSINIQQEDDKYLVTLLDHHATADWLNRYNWAHVCATHEDNQFSSGTSMLWRYLGEKDELADFVEKVRRYDTWDWFNKYDDTHAKQLNDLLYIIGREKFVERFLVSVDTTFNESEQLVLELEQNKIEHYIKRKKRDLVEAEVLQYRVGVVFAEQYHSELGNQLALEFEDLDFIAMVNPSSRRISYRGVKEEIDLGTDIARVFGGGGHPRAAGSQFDETIITKLIEEIFKTEA